MARKYKIFGFTLIELLIVVAIIAILAAVALPNFLDAQTRAKVTRTMADMRSIGTAMRTYLIDFGNYPSIPGGAADAYSGWFMVEGASGIFPGTLLTTPVSYMSTIPSDYFNNRKMKGTDQAINHNFSYSFWANIKKPGLHNWKTGPIENWVKSMHSYLHDMFPKELDWNLESCGPSLSWWGGGGLEKLTPHSYIYDPTNGTVSVGMISYSDMGWISPRNR